MYNSRPRKMNYGGYSSSFAVPENYSGNAFRNGQERDAEEEEKIRSEESARVDEKIAEESSQPTLKLSEEREQCAPPCQCNKRQGFGFELGNLFGGKIGFEELLIIGLIFLIAQKENNEDIIVLLALLLFIG